MNDANQTNMKSPKSDTFCPRYDSCVYLPLVGAGEVLIPV